MKKLITLLMLTAMLLGVAGCGGSTEKKAAYPADGDITVIIPKAPDLLPAKGINGKQVRSRK